MTKADIINDIVSKTGINKEEASTIVESLMQSIKTNMITGNEVFLRGFGSFILKKRAQKTARNISQKTAVIIPAHFIPKFKPCKEFATAVKGNVK